MGLADCPGKGNQKAGRDRSLELCESGSAIGAPACIRKDWGKDHMQMKCHTSDPGRGEVIGKTHGDQGTEFP